MNRKVSVTISVIVFATTLLVLSLGQPIAKADYSWVVGNYPNDDTFCICIHSAINTANDCCVGMGVEDWYDTNYPNAQDSNYYYYEGQWSFDANVGYNWANNYQFYPSASWHSCTYNIMYKGTSYYAGTQFYDPTSPYWYNGELTLTCWYPGPNINYYVSFNPDALSVTGQSYMAFQQISNHNNILYMSATPIPYNLMTASGTLNTGWHP